MTLYNRNYLYFILVLLFMQQNNFSIYEKKKKKKTKTIKNYNNLNYCLQQNARGHTHTHTQATTCLIRYSPLLSNHKFWRRIFSAMAATTAAPLPLPSSASIYLVVLSLVQRAV